MEVFEWYLGKPDGSYVKVTDPSTATELPQFLVSVEDFVGPLYRLLLKGGERQTAQPVFDKTVKADPRLHDPSLWDGTDLEEIKRVNPDFIRLLAAIPETSLDSLCDAWISAPGVRDQITHWSWSSPSDAEQNRTELGGILRNVIALAKKSIATKKDVMERFFWATK